jgi:hypothetical protein
VGRRSEASSDAFAHIIIWEKERRKTSSPLSHIRIGERKEEDRAVGFWIEGFFFLGPLVQQRGIPAFLPKSRLFRIIGKERVSGRNQGRL